MRGVGKIEAVRPGGVFTATLGDPSLPELLMGILRGNLSGSLFVELGPPNSNWVHFKDGVPVAVVLPALGAVGSRLRPQTRYESFAPEIEPGAGVRR